LSPPCPGSCGIFTALRYLSGSLEENCRVRPAPASRPAALAPRPLVLTLVSTFFSPRDGRPSASSPSPLCTSSRRSLTSLMTPQPLSSSPELLVHGLPHLLQLLALSLCGLKLFLHGLPHRFQFLLSIPDSLAMAADMFKLVFLQLQFQPGLVMASDIPRAKLSLFPNCLDRLRIRADRIQPSPLLWRRGKLPRKASSCSLRHYCRVRHSLHPASPRRKGFGELLPLLPGGLARLLLLRATSSLRCARSPWPCRRSRR